jgi:hypothetical protein
LIPILHEERLEKQGCLWGCAWWYMTIFLALESLRQENLNFEASLGYIARPSIKKKKKRERETISR